MEIQRLKEIIEKQSKEIEELKEKEKNLLFQLKDMEKEYTNLADRYKIQKGLYETYGISKDKIKAKIEYNKVFNDNIHKYTTLTLEELLEEE